MTAIEEAATTGLDVEIRPYRRQSYAALELTVPVSEVGPAVADGFRRVFKRLGAIRALPAGPPFLIASPPRDGSIHVTLGVPTRHPVTPAKDVYPSVLAEGNAAVVVHHGPYSTIEPLYARLEEWIIQHGRSIAGPPREVYLNGPGDVATEDDYRTELVWPVV